MTDVLEFWFPNNDFNKFWFDKTKDKLITNQFYNRLKVLENTYINCQEKSDEELLEIIIILDQFSRNIYRDNKEQIKLNDIKSLHLANYFFDNRKWNNLPLNHLIFYLMPFRHTNNIQYYQKIFEILNLYQKKNDNIDLYNRFYKATKSRFNLL